MTKRKLTRSDTRSPPVATRVRFSSIEAISSAPSCLLFPRKMTRSDGGAGGRLLRSKTKHKHQNRFSRSPLLPCFHSQASSAPRQPNFECVVPGLNCRVSIRKEATCGCVPVPLRRRNIHGKSEGGSTPGDRIASYSEMAWTCASCTLFRLCGTRGRLLLPFSFDPPPGMMQKDSGDTYDIRCVSRQSHPPSRDAQSHWPS